MSRDCSVAFPHGTTGLTAVCDCDISFSSSLSKLFLALLFGYLVIRNNTIGHYM